MLESYIDVVVEGGLEFGEDFARELIETTSDWSDYWLNDRELARRRRDGQQTDPRMATTMKEFDFHKVIDNSVVSRLVKEGFFEKLFGAGIKAEEERRAKLAYR